MRGQRSIFDPFPDTIDLNQGSNSNNTSMDESDDWNNMLSPMERRLLNNDLSSEVNFSGHQSFRSLSSWDVGESSSRANLRDPVANDGLKVELDWSPSYGTQTSRLEEPHFGSSVLHPRDGFSGGQFAAGPSNTQSSGANTIPTNVALDVRYGGNNNDNGHGIGFATDSSGIGNSSECGSDSSLGNWGLSSKRKALEGTSRQSFAGDGSSSCFPQAENIVRHSVPICYNASSGLNISSALVDPLPVNHQEQVNGRIGVGMRSDTFPRSTATPESSQRHFGLRESTPYSSISSTGNPTRRSNASSSNRQISLNEFLEQTSSNPSNQQPHVSRVPDIPRNAPSFPWSGNVSSSSSAEGNFRSSLRNNVQYHDFVPSPESRNLVQDPTNWSLATGRGSINGGGGSSSSRNGLATGSRPFNGEWTPQLNPMRHTQQRVSEFPPWTLFPSGEVEPGGRNGHFPPFPSGSSSSEDNLIPSGFSSRRHHHHQPYSRSAFLEVPDEWRALAVDIEGRQRLVSEIRQVLNAMRRGESLRAEDYMLFDPFINGVAELHDRHRDMRLDVDNMSYEELLALEERMGNVNTGLTEEAILKSLKQRKYVALMGLSTQNLEPCCICREEYDTGEDIGSLDCGHDFHRDCIKQWLAQKNLCPICKMTGLGEGDH